jgi:hypothetical protein
VRRAASTTPRAGTFARAGKFHAQLWFGRRRADDAGDGRQEMGRRDVRPPSDSKISNEDAKENDGKKMMVKKKPAADFSARARRFLRWCRYAPDLPDGSNVFLRRKRNAENSMKRVWLDETDICDDGCVPLICRTRQVHRLLHWRRIEASN